MPHTLTYDIYPQVQDFLTGYMDVLDCPKKITIGLSAWITFEIPN